jgi:hypothetical protein
LLNKLADEERKHATAERWKKTSDGKARKRNEAESHHKLFLLQVVPWTLGLMDGSISALARCLPRLLPLE